MTPKPMTRSERKLLEAIHQFLDLPTAADWDQLQLYNEALKHRTYYLVGVLTHLNAATASAIIGALAMRAAQPLDYEPEPQLDKALPSHG